VEAISEILVADTDSESGAETSIVEDYFVRKKEKRNNNKNCNKPQQKSPYQTLASKIINPTALSSVFFSRAKKGYSV
jgi:hypothetical protein